MVDAVITKILFQIHTRHQQPGFRCIQIAYHVKHSISTKPCKHRGSCDLFTSYWPEKNHILHITCNRPSGMN
jgi:hypothetical protein